MVDMITMLTSVPHINIEEYKNPVNTLKPPSLTRFAFFCTIKISVRFQVICLMIPKNMSYNPQKKVLDNPKKEAWQLSSWFVLSCIIVRHVFGDLRINLRKHAWQSSGIILGSFRYFLEDLIFLLLSFTNFLCF